MNEERFETVLATLIDSNADFDNDDEDAVVAEVATYGDAGILTMNRGLVVRMVDGSEFQLTIVRSREGR